MSMMSVDLVSNMLGIDVSCLMVLTMSSTDRSATEPEECKSYLPPKIDRTGFMCVPRSE
jgi:hypothetical protein